MLKKKEIKTSKSQKYPPSKSNISYISLSNKGDGGHKQV